MVACFTSLLALSLLFGGSAATAKISCPDTTESPASSASTSDSGSAASGEGSTLVPEALIYNQNDFRGERITVYPTVQRCLTFNCIDGRSITWDTFEQVSSNRSLFLSAFPQEYCQGDDLGPWPIASIEFPSSLNASASSVLVWEGQPTWTTKDYGCYEK